MNTNLTTKLNIISCTFIPQEEALALPLQKLKDGKNYTYLLPPHEVQRNIRALGINSH